MKKLSLILFSLTTLFLTGCSNIHEFINNDIITALAPNATSAIKQTFYSDRYQYNVPPERRVPTEFGIQHLTISVNILLVGLARITLIKISIMPTIISLPKLMAQIRLQLKLVFFLDTQLNLNLVSHIKV